LPASAALCSRIPQVSEVAGLQLGAVRGATRKRFVRRVRRAARVRVAKGHERRPLRANGWEDFHHTAARDARKSLVAAGSRAQASFTPRPRSRAQLCARTGCNELPRRACVQALAISSFVTAPPTLMASNMPFAAQDSGHAANSVGDLWRINGGCRWYFRDPGRGCGWRAPT